MDKGRQFSSRMLKSGDYGVNNPHPKVADIVKQSGIEGLTLSAHKCVYCGARHNSRANATGRTRLGDNTQRGRVNALIRHIELRHPDKPNYAIGIRDKHLGFSKEDPIAPARPLDEAHGEFIDKRFGKLD